MTGLEILGPHLATILIAALPVAELRVALPLAIAVYHLPVWQAFALSVVGNLIPIAIVFWLLPPFVTWAKQHSPFISRLLDRYFLALERRHHQSYDRWGALALAIFVGVPLPGTGAWTGAVLAVLFSVEKRYAAPAIALGVLIAACIVLGLTTGAIQLLPSLPHLFVS